MTKVRNIANPARATLSTQCGIGHSRATGFTLLEIIVAMSLMLLIIGIAIPNISGVIAEDKLRRAAAVIETTARQNMLQALNSQQTVLMELSAGAFGTTEEFSGMLLVRRFGESVFRKPKRGEAWEFSPSGICEPIEVRISGPAGQIEMGFDPLTACAKRKSIQVKG
jgi:type II secretory pathway pseudopilin PulG